MSSTETSAGSASEPQTERDERAAFAACAAWMAEPRSEAALGALQLHGLRDSGIELLGLFVASAWQAGVDFAALATPPSGDQDDRAFLVEAAERACDALQAMRDRHISTVRAGEAGDIEYCNVCGNNDAEAANYHAVDCPMAEVSAAVADLDNALAATHPPTAAPTDGAAGGERWIPVGERLPDIGQDVDIALDDGSVLCGAWRMDDAGDWWWNERCFPAESAKQWRLVVAAEGQKP